MKTNLPDGNEHRLVRRVVVRTEEFLERLSRLPRVIVRDLGRDVVSDVRLADTVCGKMRKTSISMTTTVRQGR
jgi:hypothetical protein